MSIQRYDPEARRSCEDYYAYMERDPMGEWVKYDDHASLLAQRDAEVARLSRPSPAVARLVEATRDYLMARAMDELSGDHGVRVEEALTAVEKEMQS